MRRERLAAGAAPHFIGCWALEDDGLCDGLVAHFEANAAAQKPGFVGGGVVDPSFKQSIDLTLAPEALAKGESPVLGAYFERLNHCFWDYLEEWAFLKSFLDEVHIGSFNIQKYADGDHFGGLHSERTALANAHRVLVWMTYLNDVATGGETEFPHFALKVRPAKGKTLIWPAEWTHAHRGCVVERGPKYIVTGWMHFAK
jgi:prolyl 4-hydroxylase